MYSERDQTRSDLKKTIEIIEQRQYELKREPKSLRLANRWASALLTITKGVATTARALTT